MNLNNFDAEQVKPVSFDVLPDGWYEAVLSESGEKVTGAGDTGLNMTFTIIQEQGRDRNIWEFLNINHSTSEKAKQISCGKLSAICRAVGVLRPKDSTELHNIPLLIKVGSERRQDNGELKNVIKDYKPRAASAAVQPTNSAPPPVPAGSGAAPWKR